MHAGFDWIWVIIFVVVALSQGWKKVSEQMGGGEEEPAPPRPAPKRPPRPLNKQPEVWRVGDNLLREFVEQVRQVPAPPPIRLATPVPAAPPPPPPAPEKPAPPVVSHRAPSRASIWGTALRDKSNLRNVILSAEIIGPPKGLN